MNAKNLIINADGYGFTPGVNEGIIRTFEAGLVSSTSCTPNFGFLNSAGEVQKKYPSISFGIHFNLSVGRPVSKVNEVPSLVNQDGEFLGADLLPKIFKGQVSMQEMEKELEAQAALLADQGVRISHFDGHQNRHLWPMYFEACLRTAHRFGIKAIRSHRRCLYTNSGPLTFIERVRYYSKNPKRIITHLGGQKRTSSAEKEGLRAAARLITPGYADDSHKTLDKFWFGLAHTLPSGTSEVYCHPGIPDDLLRANAYYVDERAEETRVLSEPNLKSYFKDCGINIINFWDLIRMQGQI